MRKDQTFIVMVVCVSLLLTHFQIDGLSEERGATAPHQMRYPEYVDRWAIIVGISEFKDERLNLKYADRDAEELYTLLQDPSGGGFEKDHIFKLVNGEATTAAITRALRTFLKKPAREDIVLVYFASHGAPDPDRPKNIYLLTHDTNSEDISGTALPMREIQESLNDNLLAERVILLADTCHSAAVGVVPGTRGTGNAGPVNRYLQELSKIKPGMALMTSAEANEVAREHEKWGGGHGVFTYYILQGMKGEADTQQADGTVTVGELFEYVRIKVKEATENQQHPSIGQSSFDRNLPMAITGGRTAHELYRLGRGLYDLGMRIEEPWVLRSASQQFEEANRLARATQSSLPEGDIYLGKSLLAVEDFEQAEKVLRNAARKKTADPDALFYLAIAYQKLNQYQDVRQAIQEYLERDPHSSKKAWLQAQLDEPHFRNRYALLIGVSRLPNKGLNIPGVKPDIENMEDLLTSLGFSPENVTVLQDAHATREAIIRNLHRLGNNLKRQDFLWIHHSGLNDSSEASKTIILPYDSDGRLNSQIRMDEFHGLIEKIPSRHKFITLDSQVNQKLLDLASRANAYTLFSAAQPGGEVLDNLDGGVFTHSLARVLRETDSPLSYGRLAELVAEAMIAKLEEMGTNRKQIPILVGPREATFRSDNFWLLDLFFDLTEGQNWGSMRKNELFAEYKKALMDTKIVSPPQAFRSIGLASLDRRDFVTAEAAFERAAHPIFAEDWRNTLVRVAAKVGTGNFSDAVTLFETARAESKGEIEKVSGSQELADILRNLSDGKKSAFLVGIDDYSLTGLDNLKSSKNNVFAMKRLLMEKFEFYEDNIQILVNEDATRTNILESMESFMKRNPNVPKVFFFSGRGSRSITDESRRIVPVDGRKAGHSDITLGELQKRVGPQREELVSLFDCGWISEKAVPFPLLQKYYEGSTRGASFAKDIDSQGLGATTLFANLRQGYVPNQPELGTRGVRIPLSEQLSVDTLDGEFTDPWDGKVKDFGNLTYNLITNLMKEDASTLTYDDLIGRFVELPSVKAPIAVGDVSRLVFQYRRGLSEEIWAKIKSIIEEPIIDETLAILQRTIERRQGIYPEGFLNLGLAYGYRREYQFAISSLETAVMQGKGRAVENHARFHLGRILLESKVDLARAVAELRFVTQSDPSNVNAAFYLGQAIRGLVDQDLLQEAEDTLGKYLQKGASLGRRQEVQEFLNTQKAKRQPKTLTR